MHLGQHSQALLVHDLDHAAQPSLAQLWCLRHTRQRSVSQKQGPILSFRKLRSFSDRERPDSDGDLNAGCAVAGHDLECLSQQFTLRQLLRG